jgi:hypothetical protein
MRATHHKMDVLCQNSHKIVILSGAPHDDDFVGVWTKNIHDGTAEAVPFIERFSSSQRFL